MSVHQQHITITNIYSLNKALKYMGEIDNLIIVGDFKILFSIMDETTRYKINKEIEYLNNTINQLVLTTHIGYFTQQQQYTHSSQLHMEYSLGKTIYWITYNYSINLKRSKSCSVSSDHNEMKLDVNSEENIGNSQIWGSQTHILEQPMNQK